MTSGESHSVFNDLESSGATEFRRLILSFSRRLFCALCVRVAIGVAAMQQE